MEAAGLSIDDPVDEIAKAIGWPQDQVRETVKNRKIYTLFEREDVCQGSDSSDGSYSKSFKEKLKII